MKRFEMIKDKDYFSSIIKTGKYRKNKYFVVYYINNESNKYTHFGIAIRNSIGKAHVRNRLKRQTRSIINNNKNLFKKTQDYIIMIRNECLGTSFKVLNESLVDVMKGIN